MCLGFSREHVYVYKTLVVHFQSLPEELHLESTNVRQFLKR